MTKLRCCSCQQELFYTYQQDGILPNPNKGKVDGVFCDNCKMYGNETIWQELIRTRKALDIAINVLNRVKDVKYEEYIDEKLEQINEIIKGGDNE